MKDLLFYEGYDVNSPRAVLRQGFRAGYLGEDDCEILIEAVVKRHSLIHIYRKEIALEAETLIKNRYWPVLFRLHAAFHDRANG